jgi:hypothetical protein
LYNQSLLGALLESFSPHHHLGAYLSLRRVQSHKKSYNHFVFFYRLMVRLLGLKTISSVPVIPFALMLGVISAVMGLIVGIIYALLFGTLMSAVPFSSEYFDFGWLQVLFSVGAIVIMPILGFVGGFIQGVIYAAVYNFLAPRIGGIQLRFKEDTQTPPQS